MSSNNNFTTEEFNRKMSDLTPVSLNMMKERRFKTLKRQVEDCREFIVLAYSVLIWEQNWYPGLLSAISSGLFFGLWIVDPTLVTSLSLLCLFYTLAEASLPTLHKSFFNASYWTGNKERQLEDFCRTVVDYQYFFQSHFKNLQDMKDSQPKLYYSVVVISLSFLAWLGNCNNLFLSYVFVTMLLMVPGLIHHGFLQKYYTASLLTIASVLRGLSGDKVKTK